MGGYSDLECGQRTPEFSLAALRPAQAPLGGVASMALLRRSLQLASAKRKGKGSGAPLEDLPLEGPSTLHSQPVSLKRRSSEAVVPKAKARRQGKNSAGQPQPAHPGQPQAARPDQPQAPSPVLFELGQPPAAMYESLWPTVITVGSACSGMGTEHWALKDMTEYCFQQVFWCERDDVAREFLEANMPAGVRSFRDVMSEEFYLSAPPCDVLVAGFPCQPFSIQGKNLGVTDPAGRGTVVLGILRYVAKHMPRIVILENVAGLVTRHRDVLQNVKDVLEKITDVCGNVYTVSWTCLDSLKHGIVPCKRNRVYIVAVKGARRENVASLATSGEPATGGHDFVVVRLRFGCFGRFGSCGHDRTHLAFASSNIAMFQALAH